MSQGLTTEQFKARLNGTYRGQAHFAGEGPLHHTCRTCQHWAGSDKQRFASGRAKGLLKDGPCRKYAEMVGVAVAKCPKIPEGAKSCRFHLGNPSAPAIRRADK